MTELQEYEIFQPGDLVKLKAAPGFTPKHTFLLLVGGYTVVGDWMPVATTASITSDRFVKVGTL